MPASKTGSPLPASKGVFDAAKAEAAQAVMQQPSEGVSAARNRKAGGRGVRVSGYLPVEIDEALRDEVIKRTVAQHRTVSFNDVLCSILADWLAHRNEAHENC
jgi:hypothetical protein